MPVSKKTQEDELLIDIDKTAKRPGRPKGKREEIYTPPTNERLDNLDRKILNIIMRNARVPSKDVAAVCGVSRAAIHQRIQRLIDAKIIIGSGYNVDHRILGYHTCTYVGINLQRGAMYRDVVPELEKIPEIVECHFTTGPYSMLVKLYARDNEHLMELLNSKIQMIPGVNGTETLISLDQSFTRGIPVYYNPTGKPM